MRTVFRSRMRVGALLGIAVLLAACRPGRRAEAGFSEGGVAEALAPPIYFFDGEPLNLGAESRARVDRWVEYFRERRPYRFALFLRRTGRYEFHIRRALEADGLPEDFLYLSLIESGMNPNARSRSEAVGLWQFLESTGTVYGLEITPLVDERRRPERATRAAISYLTDLHEQFGDWFLAAAAYNAGPTRLRRALRRSGASDYWSLVEGGYLPRETSEYVPKLLAAVWLGQEPGLRGFPLLRKQAPPEVDRVRLYGRNRLSVVAAAAGVPEEAVRDLNPWLIEGVTPAARWTEVRLPAGTLDRFEEVYALIPAHHRSGTLTHSVLPGETLGSIARGYGVSLAALRAANPALQPRHLPVGLELQVPPEVVEGPVLARLPD
ncbi:MAG: transglycosylase SLT domain-containing protein, partial [Gemmatimonadota bacterium]